KFRTFLLTALDRFAIDQWRKESHAPVAGGPALSPVVEPAPDVFAVAWAMRDLAETICRMQAGCKAKQRPDLWGIFEARTLAPLLGAQPLSYKLLAERYRLESDVQANNRNVTALAMFRRIFRQVIAEDARGDVEAEVEDFRTIFS